MQVTHRVHPSLEGARASGKADSTLFYKRGLDTIPTLIPVFLSAAARTATGLFQF